MGVFFTHPEFANDRRADLAETESTMLPLGTPAPNFSLPDPGGKIIQLTDFSDADGLIVAFLSNHCPFVKHIRSEVARFAGEMQNRNIAMVAINSNDVATYVADSPANMQIEIDNHGYTFPYLYDESQEVAKAYRAACTPEFYLFDGHRQLVYRGRFDGATPGNGVPVTGDELRAATTALLSGEAPDAEQQPGIGCNIKWKAGNEPEYFNRR
jgi:peroxiredoxin